MDIIRVQNELAKDLRQAIAQKVSLSDTKRKVGAFVKARQAHLISRIRSNLESLSSVAPGLKAMTRDNDPKRILATLQSTTITETGTALPRVPEDVASEMRADHSELTKCMEAGCYRSAIILCARLMETALHRKYYEATGKDLLEKSPGIGLGNVIAKLSAENITLDPAITNQIHLINQVRIHSVHKKKTVFRPSETQAKAIVMYTLDVIRQLF